MLDWVRVRASASKHSWEECNSWQALSCCLASNQFQCWHCFIHVLIVDLFLLERASFVVNQFSKHLLDALTHYAEDFWQVSRCKEERGPSYKVICNKCNAKTSLKCPDLNPHGSWCDYFARTPWTLSRYCNLPFCWIGNNLCIFLQILISVTS